MRTIAAATTTSTIPLLTPTTPTLLTTTIARCECQGGHRGSEDRGAQHRGRHPWPHPRPRHQAQRHGSVQGKHLL